MHAASWQTNYVSAAGNHAGEAELPVVATTAAWFLLARVEVIAAGSAGAIVAVRRLDHRRLAFDARHATAAGRTILARRLLDGAERDRSCGVLNAGIAGNRVLSEALPAPASTRWRASTIDVLASRASRTSS